MKFNQVKAIANANGWKVSSFSGCAINFWKEDEHGLKFMVATHSHTGEKVKTFFTRNHTEAIVKMGTI